MPHNSFKWLFIGFCFSSFLLFVNASLSPSFYPTSFSTINSTNSYSFLGGSNTVGSAFCDVNGDGKTDFVRSDMNNGILIYFGEPSSFIFDNTVLDGTNGVVITGLGINYDIKCADLNNDGKDDIIADDSSLLNGGRLSVIYGAQTFPSGSIVGTTFINTSPQNGFFVKGYSSFSSYGYTNNFGDFNGDGINDLMFSTRGTTNSGFYVVYGVQNIKFPTKSGTSEYDLTALDGTNGFSIPDTNSNSMGIGFVNDDNFVDIVFSLGTGGTIAIIYGFFTPASPSATFTPLYNGVDGFKIFTPSYSLLAYSNRAICVRDMDGDGLNELIFISRGVDRYRINVLYGKTLYPPAITIGQDIDSSIGYKILDPTTILGTFCTGLSVYDVNNDGLFDIVCSGDISTTNYFVLFSSVFPPPNPYFISGPEFNSSSPLVDQCKGYYHNKTIMAYSLGDINNDGVMDIPVVNAPNNIYTVFGRSYFSIEASTNNYYIKFNDTTNSNNFQLFPNSDDDDDDDDDATPSNSLSITNNGLCPLEFLKIRLTNSPAVGDKLEFNNPDPNKYTLRQSNDYELYILAKSSLLDSLEHITLSTNRNLSEITITLEINGIKNNLIYISFEYYIDSSSSSSYQSSSSQSSQSTSTSSQSTSSQSSQSSSESVPPTNSPTTPPTVPPTSSESEKKRNIGVIIGPIIGGVALVALVAAVIIFLVLKRKKKQNDKEEPQLKNEVSMVPIFTGGKVQQIDRF